MGNAILSIELKNEEVEPGESTRRRCQASQNKLEFRAGKQLTGQVLVDIKDRIFWGGDLTVHALGIEKATITNGKKRPQTYHNERVFFRATKKLANLTGKPRSSRGNKYSFPFSISLPESLPETFSHGTRDNGCLVEYSLCASVRKFQSSCKFDVTSSPMSDIRVPCFMEPTTENIRSMGVKPCGSITFGAGVNDTHIGRGNVMELSLACRNNSTASIEHIDVKLVELIRWKVRSRSEQTKTILLNVTDLNLPGLSKAKMDRSQVRDSQRQGVDVNSRNYEAIYESLRSSENHVRLEIPTTAQDTYAGRIVTVSHYVKVYINTTRFVGNLSTKIPIQVGKPAQLHSAAPPALVQNELPPRIHLQPVPHPIPSAPDEAFDEISLPVPAHPTPTAPLGPDDGYVPFAAAVLISDNQDVINEARLQAVPETEVIVLGGIEGSNVSEGNGAVIRPSFAKLLQDMAASVNDYDMLTRRLQQPQWRCIFESLSPEQFGRIIKSVTLDFDQPRVARLLVPVLNGGNNFTCPYFISALKNTEMWNRIAMVQVLLAQCRDLASGHHVVTSELSEWERTVTARDFAAALAREREARPH